MKTPFAVAKKNALIPTLYLANLSFRLNEQGLSKFLSRYGKVSYLFMPRDKKTKKLKGVAFIQYSNKDEYERALSSLNGKSYMGRTLKASKAIENESMPFKPQEIKKELGKISTTRKKRVKKGLALLQSVRGQTQTK